MIPNLANSRHGIPRGGLKAPAGASVSNSPHAVNDAARGNPARLFHGFAARLTGGHK